MKIYMRDHGRPCGVEPKFFYSKEEAAVKCKCLPDQCICFIGIDVLEFNNELEARRFMKEYYPTVYGELK